jgi:hypothetical protein
VNLRRILFGTFALVPLGLVVACSNDDDEPPAATPTINALPEGGSSKPDTGATSPTPGDSAVVYIEAGPEDGGAKDAATAADADSGTQTMTCAPQHVASFTFTAPGKYLGQCSDEVLAQLYDACISDQNTINACNAARTAFGDCSACAFGGATAAVEHPWLVYDDRVTAFPNFGLCMATIRDESSPTDCGVAYGQFYTCLNQACVTPCADSADPAAFDACRQAALDDGICTSGAQTALGSTCSGKYQATDPTYGFCTSVRDEEGKDLDDRAYMIALARLTCGLDPNSDAGPKDAGSDADAN